MMMQANTSFVLKTALCGVGGVRRGLEDPESSVRKLLYQF